MPAHDLSRPRRSARPARALLLAVLVLLSGCGLRLETDPPPPLVPDAAEEARARTVADALALATTARLAAQGRTTASDGTGGTEDGGGPDEVAVLLLDVAAAADAHVVALGGVYDPDTGDEGAEPGPDEEGHDDDAGDERSPTTADVADVVTLLRDTAVTARADALTVEDGGLARLLASVAVHRSVAAHALGGAEPGATAPAESDEAADDDTADVDDAAGAPVTSADRESLVALVRAEDAAGQAWEVVAARRSDEARETAAAHASAHRRASGLWARAAGLVGPDDPRLAEYALDPALLADDTAAGALATVERDLAARYLALVAAEEDEARGRLLDAATEAVRTARALDGALEPLPGMPEQNP